MMESLSIALFNATGLNRFSLEPLLTLNSSISILLITETWLLPNTRFLTNWKQYHTYGKRLHPYAKHGSQGISLLVNPSCPFHICHLLSANSTEYDQYRLSFTMDHLLIHCLYLPPSLNPTQVQEILDGLPLTTETTSETIICGDFNARLGPFTGDSSTNNRGKIFQYWLDTNNLILWNNRLTFGQPTFMAHNRQSIIDYFISTSELFSPSLTIYHDLSLDSDHKLLTFSFLTHTPNAQSYTNQRLMWNINRLKNPKVELKYRQLFESELQNLDNQSVTTIDSNTTAYEHIEYLSEGLVSAIYSALDHTCQRRPNQRRDSRSDFWTPQLQQAFEYRENCYKRWRKAVGIRKLQLWIHHQKARAEFRLLLKRRRLAQWENFCNNMSSGNYSKTVAHFCRIKRGKTLKPTFSDPQGPTVAANRMASHLQNIFSGTLIHSDQPIINSRAITHYPDSDFPITESSIQHALINLPSKKAPGCDSITIEMLRPLGPILPKLLLKIFRLCWVWSYTPSNWRVAQIIPIFKKGEIIDPSNYRPISLTSIFRKILESCLQDILHRTGPVLDVAQGGFRHHRSSLDQALCLTEICKILQTHYSIHPTLAFLDIKSAYDTVDRQHIWRILSSTTNNRPLIGLLQSLFDDVSIEVILSNTTSSRFHPTTGVLQGSLLSPYLYSIYINDLPRVLRTTSEIDNLNPLELVPHINCLLYADDVVLIASEDQMSSLLQICEQHSIERGYRWNPAKCVILPSDNSHSPAPFQLYGQDLPFQTTFSYLGIPIKPGGHIDSHLMTMDRIKTSKASMNLLKSLGVNPSGFDRLLSLRLYTQICRAHLEYGLAITSFNYSQKAAFESFQNQAIRGIFGGSPNSSVLIMRHLTRLPSMQERIAILQARYLLRSLNLPPDTLMSRLLPYIKDSPQSSYYKLCRNPMWQAIVSTPAPYSNADFLQAKIKYLQRNLDKRLTQKNSLLLSHCRPKISKDPILWLPMTKADRHRCIKWRLGWLTGGKPRPCYKHPDINFSKRHALRCLDIHNRLMMPQTIIDPLSFLLNRLPQRQCRSRSIILNWKKRWPIICQILAELDFLHQHKPYPNGHFTYGQQLVEWLSVQ